MEAAFGPAFGLLDYNRESFFFDQEQRMKREFQVQTMRVKQFGLYREDVRDLIELTVAKMDNYLIVNAIQLGFCVTLLTQGRPEGNHSPQWLYWLYAMTILTAFFYTLLSIWLAMYASIAAHSFGVRILTQLVRLPIPNSGQLNAATARAREFETGSLGGSIMRIPWQRRLRELGSQLDSWTGTAPAEPSSGLGLFEDNASDNGSDTSPAGAAEAEGRPRDLAVPTSNLRHIRLFRQLQTNWQAYDAYARVCMALGANQLLHAVSYYTLQMLVSEERSPWPALACLALLAFCAWLLARLDLYLSMRLRTLAAVLLLAPPAITMVGLTLVHTKAVSEVQSDVCAPMSFLLHMAWIGFILYLARADHSDGVALPMNFRSVTYLDVFGWLNGLSQSGAPRDHTGEMPAAGATFGSVAPAANAGSIAEDDGEYGMQVEAYRLRSAPPSGLPPRMEMTRTLSASRISTAVVLYHELGCVCHRIKDELNGDLKRWEGVVRIGEEGGDMSAMVDVVSQRALVRMRARWSQESRRLNDLVPEDEVQGENSLQLREQAQKGGGELSQRVVWLQLQWDAWPTVMDYYYCYETEATTWTMPMDPDRIITLDMLEARVEDFKNEIEKLSGVLPAEEGAALTPTASGTGARAAPGSLPSSSADGLNSAARSSGAVPGAPGGTTQAASASASSATAATGTAASDHVFPAEDEEHEPAQQMQYGGDQAVRLENQALAQDFTTAGASSFSHIGAVRRDQTERHSSRSPSSSRHRTPGQVPWRTFWQGSMFIIMLWAVGFVWCVGRIFSHNIDVPILVQGATLLGATRYHQLQRLLPQEATRPRLIFTGPWPHSFFDPAGLSCEGIGSEEGSSLESLLVGGRFELHTLSVAEETSDAAWRPSLAECLAEDPEFHADGMAGLALLRRGSATCPPGAEVGSASCWPAVVILSANGTTALRCEGRGAAVEATRITIHGGPWRSILAVGPEGDGLAAIRQSDGAVVWLRRRSGGASGGGAGLEELVPDFEWSPAARRGSSTATGLLRASLLRDTMLLGLQEGSLLRAWDLKQGNGAPALWELQLPQAWRWSELCIRAGEEAAYLIARGQLLHPRADRNRDPAVWRVQLPTELFT